MFLFCHTAIQIKPTLSVHGCTLKKVTLVSTCRACCCPGRILPSPSTTSLEGYCSPRDQSLADLCTGTSRTLSVHRSGKGTYPAASCLQYKRSSESMAMRAQELQHGSKLVELLLRVLYAEHLQYVHSSHIAKATYSCSDYDKAESFAYGATFSWGTSKSLCDRQQSQRLYRLPAKPHVTHHFLGLFRFFI